MACRLVGEDDRCIVDIAQRQVGLALDMHQIADLMELLLTHRLIIDDEGIVEVTSLDQVIGKECLYFTDEDEGTARSDLRIKVLEVLKGCELIVQYG